MSDFVENRLPGTYDYRSRRGAGHLTQIFVRDSGLDTRRPRWQFGQRRYSLDYRVRGPDDLANLLIFYLCRQGNAIGFRFKDLYDYTSAANGVDAPTGADQVIYPVGDSATTYQLSKTYTSGGVSVVRAITKPVNGTVLVTVDGTPASPAIDATSGLVVFANPPGGTVRAGFEFDVPVRFDMDRLEITEDEYRQGSTTIDLIELLRQDLHEDYAPPVFE